MIGKTVSHYRILSQLGAGGMGVVYKAEDTLIHRTVALKFLTARAAPDPVERDRLFAEATAAGKLDHPNIGSVYELDESDEGFFIAMAFYDGETLQESIARSPLPFEHIVDLALQIASGLSAAHAQGIVHRDIKPNNIMVTPGGVVKIVDFGIAKLAGSANVTEPGTTPGTAAYMSPEQAMGGTVDQRSDIFSYGIVLYELTTGQRPFRGNHELAILYEIVNVPPHPLLEYRPDTPPELEAIIGKSLVKELEKRYQRMDEVIADLTRLKRRLEGGLPERPPEIPSEIRAELPAGHTQAASPTGRWLVLAGVLLTLIALWLAIRSGLFRGGTDEVQSVAVLPLRNLSAGGGPDYFSEGITEDIIAHLSKVAGLRVISLQSSSRFRDSKASYADIGQTLGVGQILDGSVRLAEGRVRIVTQLVSAKTGETLLADTYDRELTDVFAIQSDVAERIASALEIRLTSAERDRLASRPTASTAAYSYYLKGREYYNHYGGQDNETAIRLFKKAIEIDPAYATAYAGLGDAYAQRVNKFGFPPAWLDSALASASFALRLDPGLADAYKAQGLVYQNANRYGEALRAYRKAVELNPNNDAAVANIGSILALRGDLPQAVSWLRRAVSLNPAIAFGYIMLGDLYAQVGMDAEADSVIAKATELQPELPAAQAKRSALHLLRGEFTRAEGEIRRAAGLFPNDVDVLNIAGDVALFQRHNDTARTYYERAKAASSAGGTTTYTELRLGFIALKDGKKSEGRKILRQLSDDASRAMQVDSESALLPLALMGISAALDDLPAVRSSLRSAVRKGWLEYRLIERDPLYEGIRTDPEVQRVVLELKQKVQQMREKIVHGSL